MRRFCALKPRDDCQSAACAHLHIQAGVIGPPSIGASHVMRARRQAARALLLIESRGLRAFKVFALFLFVYFLSILFCTCDGACFDDGVKANARARALDFSSCLRATRLRSRAFAPAPARVQAIARSLVSSEIRVAAAHLHVVVVVVIVVSDYRCGNFARSACARLRRAMMTHVKKRASARAVRRVNGGLMSSFYDAAARFSAESASGGCFYL